MKNKILLALLLCTSVMFLSGCGKNEESATGDTETKKATVRQIDSRDYEYEYENIGVLTAPGKNLKQEPVQKIKINDVEGTSVTVSDSEVKFILTRFEKEAFTKAGKEVPANIEVFFKAFVPQSPNVNFVEFVQADYNNEGVNHYYVGRESETAYGIAEVQKNPFNPFNSPGYAQRARLD